jgi:type III pantothenate kinase
MSRSLVVSIGNSTVFCGLFSGDRLIKRFRTGTNAFRRELAARIPGPIDRAAICSVVPRLTPVISREVTRRFGIHPRLLTTDSKHGLIIGYHRPRELGTDRLAAGLGARKKFPGKNILVIDCGTAATVTALSREGKILGGAILPGLDLWLKALAARTAQLPLVPLRRPATALGRSTRDGILSGTWYGHIGALRELIQRIRLEAFGGAGAILIGTGGRAELLASEVVFDLLEPDLILYGLEAFISAP